MSNYLVKINKSSCISNKTTEIPNSILNYFYYFNNLSEKCNQKMKMHFNDKPLNLLGKFKLNIINNRTIIFSNNNFEIIIYHKNYAIIKVSTSII